ncbi:MAG: hypothetical protein GY761_21760, partial [Hyphomicrobiales bacterium]|nr:hypothetical protein [Hyphomicrobiales bacterium]
MENNIALDSQGNAHISHWQWSGTKLMYSHRESGVWQTETLVESGVAWDKTVILIDSLDQIHIIYSNATNLMVLVNQNGVWSEPTPVAPCSGHNCGVSAVMNAANHIHLAYSTTDTLMVATNQTGAWVETAVANVNTEGNQSIAIGSNNVVHLSYYDSVNRNLMYANNATGTWTLQTVDSEGDVGISNALTLDANNKPHIGYREDVTNPDNRHISNSNANFQASQPQLKYAYQTNDCTTIHDPGNGWVIEMCKENAAIGLPMEITLDGVVQNSGHRLVRVYHQSENDLGVPQVMVLYSSGFLRLKQNADPNPAIPFGSSFILGPAYWSGDTYNHNPQLESLKIDTSWLPSSSLRIQASGQNQAFDVSYDLTLPPPRDRQTRLHVSQTYTATTNIAIDTAHRNMAEGFKLLQFSSMYINEGESCNGEPAGCHDSNAVRFIGNDLVRQQVAFADLSLGNNILTTTTPIGSTWLDLLHTDDTGWQGNTPNVRVALDELPNDHTITPQGWIEADTNPNNDNVGLWLHDDGLASQNWTAGQSDQIGYWLLAQDDPPAPWTDLGLRTGKTFLDFETDHTCVFVNDAGQATSGSINLIDGYQDTALQMEYDIGQDNGNWAQIRCNFSPPLNLSAYDHLRFDWRGDPDSANSIEVALVSLD